MFKCRASVGHACRGWRATLCQPSGQHPYLGFCYLPQPLLPCLRFVCFLFPCGCDKQADKGSLRDKGLCSGVVSTTGRNSGGRSLKQQVTAHPQSGSREQWVIAAVSFLSPPVQSRIPVREGTTHSGRVSPLQLKIPRPHPGHAQTTVSPVRLETSGNPHRPGAHCFC